MKSFKTIVWGNTKLLSLVFLLCMLGSVILVGVIGLLLYLTLISPILMIPYFIGLIFILIGFLSFVEYKTQGAKNELQE